MGLVILPTFATCPSTSLMIPNIKTSPTELTLFSNTIHFALVVLMVPVACRDISKSHRLVSLLHRTNSPYKTLITMASIPTRARLFAMTPISDMALQCPTNTRQQPADPEAPR
jgi:hypothetical protein